MASVGKHLKPSGSSAAGGSSSAPSASVGRRFAHSEVQPDQGAAAGQTQATRRVGTRFKNSANDGQSAVQGDLASQETVRMPSARPMQPTSASSAAAPDLSQYTYEAREPVKPKKLPLVLGIAGTIVACGSGLFSIVGIALGVAALVLRFRAKKAGAGCKAPRATLVFGILALVFGVAMFAYVPKGAIEISVRAEEWEGSYGDVQVDVTGTTDEGESVDLSVAVTPGQTKELDDLEAGSYELTVDAGELSFDDVVYQVDPAQHSVAFDGTTDEAVEFAVTVDGQATQKLIAEKAAAEKKAAEEKAAKEQEEAERKAQEAEKREKEEAEKKAQEEAERQVEEERQAEEAAATSSAEDQQDEQQIQQESGTGESAGVISGNQEQGAAEESPNNQNQSNDRTVYVTNTGEKYHSAGCSSLRKSSIPMSISDAQAQGYTPCGNCNPGV